MHIRYSTTFIKRLGLVLSQRSTWPVYEYPSVRKTKHHRRSIFDLNGVAATKAKRGCKRKIPATEQAEAGPSVTKRREAAVKEVEQANAMPVLWAAPVAKMY
jgi:hypothetical protein